MATLRDLLRDLMNRLRPPTVPPRPPPPPAVPPAVPPAPPTVGDTVVELLTAHNARRAARGLSPLRLSGLLVQAAGLHARDMAATRRMSHTGSDGSDPFVRMRRVGYRFSSAGENVAAGQRSVEEAVTGWMNSPGHRANILGNYTEAGFGVAADAAGKKYWCACFATPQGVRAFIMDLPAHHFPPGLDADGTGEFPAV